MGEKIENGTIQIGEIIGKTLDGRDIYKFTELGMAENVKIIAQQYKAGDFVVSEAGSILIFKEKVGDRIYDHAFFNNVFGLNILPMIASCSPIKRHANEEEKQIMLDALAKEGKRWNEERLCVEDIPKRKFKVGDKVRIKHGVSSKTHRNISPGFMEEMDGFIGTAMTVNRYTDMDGYVVCDEHELWFFNEDWLEPYTDELKDGDLAIFWDNEKRIAVIKSYDRSNGGEEEYFRHKDQNGFRWRNAIKFESKEQYKRLLKGEI